MIENTVLTLSENRSRWRALTRGLKGSNPCFYRITLAPWGTGRGQKTTWEAGVTIRRKMVVAWIRLVVRRVSMGCCQKLDILKTEVDDRIS